MAAAWRRAIACWFSFALLGLAGTAAAQTSGVDLVGIATGATDQFYFECSGSPTCSGEFVVVSQKSGCSNPVSFAGTIQVTAPNLSTAGPVSGSGTLTSDFDWQRNPDGTCTPVAAASSSNPITFSGTSDGAIASVTFTVTDTDGNVHQVAGTLVPASATFGSAQVSGSFAGATGGSGHVSGTFTCVGSPVCTGTYSAMLQDNGCSNSFPISGALTFTGFDLASGNLGGTLLLDNADTQDQLNADGTCSLKSSTQLSIPYSGSFSGNGGSFTINGTNDNGIPFSIPGTFTASGIGGNPPPTTQPPFQVSVQSSITATTASATAQIVPPATDVGKTVSVYVFAFAPRSLVKSAARLAMKDDSGGCELAQIDPATGQLRAASASSLAPALTATLSAQGQSVTILNNASTPTIAGATFFVGYGADASTMISNGGNVGAVQIPGAQQCPAVFPETPAGLSGLWWGGPAESGWGIDFTERHDAIFAAFYTYDSTGNAKWYVSPNCKLPASGVTSGRCTGDLFEVNGASPLFGLAPGGTGGAASKAGSLQVDFTDTSHATLSFAIGSVSRTVPITRQPITSGITPPTIDYTDLWYAGASGSGWGMAISQQFNIMFLAWFVYDANGKPVWYVAPACAVTASGNGCTGDLFQVSGPPFASTFDPSKIQASKVGTVAATFSDPNNGTINYTVNGTTGTKTITRQVF